MSRRNKRFQIIADFCNEMQPQTLEQFNVIYRNTNMLRYIQRLFHSVTARALQTALSHQFPVLRDLFGSNRKREDKPAPEQILYVGLHDCAVKYKAELESQIQALRTSIAYAQLRLANPKQNVLSVFYPTEKQNTPDASQTQTSGTDPAS